MREWMGKRYWLVGASEGLGAALARDMSGAGAELVLSARSREPLEQLAAALPGPATVVPLDVSDDRSVADAAQAIGRIDGVVFLAGVYWPMPAQAIETAKAVAMADVNFTGALRVIGVALPDMIARDEGHVVITGSLSGFRGLPGSIGYSSSKAGLMHLAESLFADLHKTGVDVQLANPGFIRTRLTDKNDFDMPFLMEPEGAAAAMFAHMNSRRFKANFPRLFSLVFRVSQFLPDWLYYRLFA